jgi:hypothetical protein
MCIVYPLMSQKKVQFLKNDKRDADDKHGHYGNVQEVVQHDCGTANSENS